jgi:hypothetical protein
MKKKCAARFATACAAHSLPMKVSDAERQWTSAS